MMAPRVSGCLSPSRTCEENQTECRCRPAVHRRRGLRQFGPPEVDVLIGSKYFAAHLPSPGYKPLYGVLWDMIGDKDLRIPYEMNSFQQAPEVVSRVWQTAAEMGYGDIFVQESGGAINDDHMPLLNAGMRVIDVIDLEYPPHHTPQDTMDKISAKSLAIVGDVAAALVTRK